jgi:hypothetical protein
MKISHRILCPRHQPDNTGENLTRYSIYTLPGFAFHLSFMRQHVVIHSHTTLCHLLANSISTRLPELFVLLHAS